MAQLQPCPSSTSYAVDLRAAVASLGNVLGSVANWLLGRYIRKFGGKWWFPVKEPALRRAQNYYGRYGRWSLLLSWVPIIGDPLTVAAGVLGEPLLRFVALVTLAKVSRYLVLACLTLWWT